MKHLRQAMEELDEEISVLEERIGLETGEHQNTLKKQTEFLKQSRTREVAVLAVAQKVAARLDHAIDHVERVLRD